MLALYFAYQAAKVVQHQNRGLDTQVQLLTEDREKLLDGEGASKVALLIDWVADSQRDAVVCSEVGQRVRAGIPSNEDKRLLGGFVRSASCRAFLILLTVTCRAPAGLDEAGYVEN